MRLKKELCVWAGCLVLAELTNLGAVIAYERPLVELVSMIGYVFVISLVYYLLIAVVRGIAALIMKLINRK